MYYTLYDVYCIITIQSTLQNDNINTIPLTETYKVRVS